MVAPAERNKHFRSQGSGWYPRSSMSTNILLLAEQDNIYKQERTRNIRVRSSLTNTKASAEPYGERAVSALRFSDVFGCDSDNGVKSRPVTSSLKLIVLESYKYRLCMTDTRYVCPTGTSVKR